MIVPNDWGHQVLSRRLRELLEYGLVSLIDPRGSRNHQDVVEPIGEQNACRLLDYLAEAHWSR